MLIHLRLTAGNSCFCPILIVCARICGTWNARAGLVIFLYCGLTTKKILHVVSQFRRTVVLGIYIRRKKTEAKAKVVASVWGTKFIQIHAAL